MSDTGFNLPKHVAAKMVNDLMMGETKNKSIHMHRRTFTF